MQLLRTWKRTEITISGIKFLKKIWTYVKTFRAKKNRWAGIYICLFQSGQVTFYQLKFFVLSKCGWQWCYRKKQRHTLFRLFFPKKFGEYLLNVCCAKHNICLYIIFFLSLLYKIKLRNYATIFKQFVKIWHWISKILAATNKGFNATDYRMKYEYMGFLFMYTFSPWRICYKPRES